MKQLYKIQSQKYIILLNSGETIVGEPYSFGVYKHKYGEEPSDKTEIFDTWEEMLQKFNYVCLTGNKTLFTKRFYIEDENFNFKRIYKDKFKSLIIKTKYQTIPIEKYPPISTLERDLGFVGYSQLVFDREKELKEMYRGIHKLHN